MRYVTEVGTMSRGCHDDSDNIFPPPLEGEVVARRVRRSAQRVGGSAAGGVAAPRKLDLSKVGTIASPPASAAE
jgi:hypothetical protein